MESAYEECLCHERHLRGIAFQRHLPLPEIYKGVKLDCGYHIDLLVAGEVIVELKSIDQLLPVHDAQLLTYLRLSKIRLGLLINFRVDVLKNGIRRKILDYFSSLRVSVPLW